MLGLSVRWSLTGTPDGTLEALREYVEEESFRRFAALEGLRFKTWRAREGEWFEGTYVFVSESARAEFQAQMEEQAADLPGSKLIGSAPVLIEPFETVAVVRGPGGFRSAPRFER